jgi:hypothetical protein
MRLWSLHPRHLDGRGLVALWREALLARKVLQGRTRGYRAHPQLERFRAHSDPLAAVEAYLCGVFREAERRGYAFDGRKVRDPGRVEPICVRRGQLDYEIRHLLSKLKVRDPPACRALRRCSTVESHPLFVIVRGGIEPWERGGPPRETRSLRRTQGRRGTVRPRIGDLS